MQNLFFILMIIFAILAIQTNSLRQGIIYLCVFSLITSFTYLLYMAPDVAIAEAIIGSTLSTILFLVALNKYKIFRIYYTKKNITTHAKDQSTMLLDSLKKFAIQEEIELDIIHTSNVVNEILKFDFYDVIIAQSGDIINIYGDSSNYHFENMQRYLSSQLDYTIKYNKLITRTGEYL